MADNLARVVHDWMGVLAQAEDEAARQSQRSGMCGVLRVNEGNRVTIGAHTSVPAGRMHHRPQEPGDGGWLPKTVRCFVQPWEIQHRSPSIYPQ